MTGLQHSITPGKLHNSDPLFTTKVKETWIFIFPDLAHEVDHPAISGMSLSIVSVFGQ
jgi:hypothetical protein